MGVPPFQETITEFLQASLRGGVALLERVALREVPLNFPGVYSKRWGIEWGLNGMLYQGSSIYMYIWYNNQS